MITEVYISSEGGTNGINIIFDRCDNDKDVTIKIVDDDRKSLLSCSFDITFKELKQMVDKLEYKE